MDKQITILRSQLEFLRCPAKEIMLSGAFGSGKTRAVCMRTVRHACIPGNFVGLCRKAYSDMIQTTLRTLLQPEGDLPPVLPEGSYVHNRLEHTISIYGGGTIYYFGFDDPLKVASLNLGAVGIDEGIQLDEQEYLMLLGRLRNNVDPVRAAFIATNPGSPSHFLYKRFFKNDPPAAPGARVIVHSNTFANPYLPQDYLNSLNDFNGQYKMRFTQGLWVAFEGLIYDRFDPSLHVIDRHGPWRYSCMGVDDGYTNPFVVLVIRVDDHNCLYVEAEAYRQGLSSSEKVKLVGSIRDEHDCRGTIFVDPSSPSLIKELRMNGLPAMPGNNDVDPGISELQKRFSASFEGVPAISLSRRCTKLRSELESYQWAQNKEVPLKQQDHGPDALRYAVTRMSWRMRDLAPVLKKPAGLDMFESGPETTYKALRSFRRKALASV